MRLWVETHATSIDNERGVASGHLDPELSECGRRQAAEMVNRYSQRGLSIVYTSDLKRSVSTAEIAFARLPVRRVQDRRLREWDYGSLSGCPVREMDELRARFVENPFPGGESLRGVVRRIEDFLHELSRDESPVLVIAHRAPCYAFEHLLGGRDLIEVVTSAWKWQPGWEYDL